MIFPADISPLSFSPVGEMQITPDFITFLRHHIAQIENQ